MSFDCSRVSRFVPKKGTKKVHKLGKKTEKTECWKWELCTKRWLAAGQKRKRWKWLSLEGPQSKAWKGRARLQTELGPHALDCLIAWLSLLKWHLQGATCKTVSVEVEMFNTVWKPLGCYVSFSFKAFTFFCQKWKIVANTLLRANVWPPTAAL